MEPSHLEAATFDELFAEIGRRFPNAVIVATREGEQSSDIEESRFKYIGSPTFTLGLLSRADGWLRRAIAKSEERYADD